MLSRGTLCQIVFFIYRRYGGTNVLKALNEAVSFKPPVYAFPVRDLNTFISHDGSRKRQNEGILRDCISLKPCTTVKSLYEVMLHHHFINGKYVRAEVLDVFVSNIFIYCLFKLLPERIILVT